MSMPVENTRLITLLVGGARSGKSHFAQDAAATSRRVAYIATAHASDEEMERKIARHRAERPAEWDTFEAPLELESVLAAQGSNYDAIIVDCLTVWTANLLDKHGFQVEPVLRHGDALCATLKQVQCKVYLVSNEVGEGVVPAFESGRAFRDALGELNQKVARVADRVILMVAGCPLAVKGSL